MDTPHINLIGGGLAGSLMAVYLARKGYRATVFERRPDMRLGGVSAGRSINLALSARGLHALRETGLYEEIMPLAIPMYGRMVHPLEGTPNFQPYSSDGQQCIYSVSRGELNKRLMTLAESFPGVEIRFQHTCESVDLESGAIRLRDRDGQPADAPGSITLACDGAFSAVRYAMQKLPRFNFSQDYLEHGYKELTIPPDAAGQFRMEPNALHIWPRESFMMIALPNPDGTFTCTLFLAFDGDSQSFAALDTPDRVRAFFSEQFPDALALMPELETEFFENPTSALVTMRCYPWIAGSRIALMGDAAHAIVPFFGQGMNAAFEDCSALSALIDRYAPDWARILADYQALRKPNTEAIADMALENFIEMRDLVNDPEFRFRKRIEHQLGQHFPQYRTRYEMVSFTRIPYEEARQRGERNDWLVDELIARGLSDPGTLDFKLAEELMAEYLAEA
jgi:kynurenine 3-monooxygenase